MAAISQPLATAQSRRYDTKQLQALDSAHYLHPFTDTAALAKKGARIIVKGEGVYIWDSEGNKIFDAMSINRWSSCPTTTASFKPQLNPRCV
jgi:putrescine---pyruvate transaminase